VPDATEVPARGFPTLIDRLGRSYDTIVVVTAPALPFADGLAIAPHCTGVVIVASLVETDRALRRTADLLRQAGGDVLGVVVTNAGHDPYTKTIPWDLVSSLPLATLADRVDYPEARTPAGPGSTAWAAARPGTVATLLGVDTAGAQGGPSLSDDDLIDENVVAPRVPEEACDP
jgi:hypothetical protein